MSVVNCIMFVCPLRQGNIEFGSTTLGRQMNRIGDENQPPKELLKLLTPPPVSMSAEGAARARDRDALKELEGKGYLNFKRGSANDLGIMDPQGGDSIKYVHFTYAPNLHKKPEDFVKAMNWLAEYFLNPENLSVEPGAKVLVYRTNIPTAWKAPLTVADIIGE